MTQSQNALERFKIVDNNVKIGTFIYVHTKTMWAVYGHPRRLITKTTKWSRIAARDTEKEIREFCAEWKLNIVEVEKPL